jgi:hypothetical protein
VLHLTDTAPPNQDPLINWLQHLSDKLNFFPFLQPQKRKKKKEKIQNYLKLHEKHPDNHKPKKVQENCNFTQVKQLLHKADAQVIWLRTFITLHTSECSRSFVTMYTEYIHRTSRSFWIYSPTVIKVCNHDVFQNLCHKYIYLKQT